MPKRNPAYHFQELHEKEFIVLADPLDFVFNRHLGHDVALASNFNIDFQFWHSLCHKVLCVTQVHPFFGA